MDRMYVFSGTGNSLAAAREAAEQLGNFQIEKISDQPDLSKAGQAERIGLVFPVYAWGMPRGVVEFIQKLKLDPKQYLFALATCGGGGAGALKQCQRLISRQGGNLSLGAFLAMPSNYIIWGDAPGEEIQKTMLRAASQKITDLVPWIRDQKIRAVEKGSWAANFFLSKMLYPLAVRHFGQAGKKFQVQETCSGCGICEKICPSRNIVLKNRQPQWGLRCEQCLACLQWCPEKAIGYAGKTHGRKRYHHPDIQVRDLFRS